MSLREIDFALRKIFKRTHNKFSATASLHGIKLPMLRDAEPVEITPESTKLHDDHLKKAQERKLLEKRRG